MAAAAFLLLTAFLRADTFLRAVFFLMDGLDCGLFFFVGLRTAFTVFFFDAVRLEVTLLFTFFLVVFLLLAMAAV